MQNHFMIVVSDAEVRRSRKQASIEADVQLDGAFVARTSLVAEDLGE